MIDEQPADEQSQPNSKDSHSGSQASPQGSQKKRGSFWRELPILLGVAIVVAIVVRAFVVQTFYIPSISMEHTLEINDRVLVNKVVYHFREPERGEIVVFRAPAEWRGSTTDEDFIKRVIAVEGDRVACCDDQGRLMINGSSLDEPYLYAENGVADAAATQQFEVVIPDGRLWLLGDHRSSSGDSMDHYQRSGGDLQVATVSADAVIGRAFLLFWPPGRATWLSPPGSFDAIPAAREADSPTGDPGTGPGVPSEPPVPVPSGD